eukprot:TRINITY_DN1661_c0_g1_i2.p1 TRINITY_DN1661_c0_g1~~TRINITY_DN1661_c0_g1_i2.p1  ORF type:complete len:212 (-),score=27.95 TRINITY_DN1661_c0_g1_i2:180-815(-)
MDPTKTNPTEKYALDAPNHTSSWVALSFASTDLIRIIGEEVHCNSLVPHIRECIKQGWPKKIQDERVRAGYHEFKLAGYPWAGSGDEAIYSRIMCCYLLAKMASLGWKAGLSLDLSSQEGDVDTWYFEFDHGFRERSMDCTVFSISFNKTDTIRTICTPSPAVTEAIRRAIQHGWKKGIQAEKAEKVIDNCYEFKVHGNPWSSIVRLFDDE